MRTLAGIGHGTVRFSIDHRSLDPSVAAALDFLGFDPSYRVGPAISELETAADATAETLLRFEALSNRFMLPDVAGRRIGELSLGTRQKLRLCLALSQPATLLLLDEPLRALDQAACAVLIDLLNQRAYGSTYALVSSHQDTGDLLGLRIDAVSLMASARD